MIFTNGTLQLRIVTENRKHPSETGYIIDKNGVSHCIRTMQMIFNPTASDNEAADLKAIWDKFGLSNQDIPQTDRADGIREYLMLSFRHMIDFLETHKKSLSDFNYEL